MRKILAAVVSCISLSLLLLTATAAYANKTFIFDPKKTTWYAYEDGELLGSGRASGGKGFCPDRTNGPGPCRTPTGTFSVLSKGGSDCKSSLYPRPNGGAPMPYCMFFSKNYAIHGANSVPAGFNASHGCIRVRPSAALWLSQNFINVGTTVVVKSY